MRKNRLTLLMATICIAVMLAVVMIPTMATATNSSSDISSLAAIYEASVIPYLDTEYEAETIEQVEDIDISEIEEIEKIMSEQEIEQRLISMLNMNYCYSSSFDSAEGMVGTAAVSLKDYLLDADGYGLCINAELVKGFIKEFYAVDIDTSLLEGVDAPQGYIAVNVTESVVATHTPVSLVNVGDEYTVVSCMKMYFGGSDTETVLVKTRFVKNTQSQFRFSIIYSEIL